jgi:hypothetical protein
VLGLPLSSIELAAGENAGDPTCRPSSTSGKGTSAIRKPFPGAWTQKYRDPPP